MIRKAYRWIHGIKDLAVFSCNARRRGTCAISLNAQIKNAKCIEVVGDISLGKGSKLLCWECYTSGKQIQVLHPHLYIGRNFRATRNLIIQCAGSIRIGDNVLVASDVFIIDYNHSLDPRNANYLDGPLDIRGVHIGDGVWIGNNAIILPGSRIGDKCVIGAGCVVSGTIEEYSMVVGNPAKVIKRWDKEKSTWVKSDKSI